MSVIHFIAFDVHCATTEMVAMTASGRITKRGHYPTTIPALVEAVQSVRRPRNLTFEEGPLAGWLKRNLQRHVDELVVCEPRRNSLIAKDSEKDDPIDALKLAQLYRGGYVKPVHHPETLGRAVFKEHVIFYHKSVRERVRLVNQAIAQCRQHGVIVQESQLVSGEKRDKVLLLLPKNDLLHFDMKWLLHTYDAAVEREKACGKELVRRARRIDEIRRFTELPGISWIRSATFYAFIDTPWRFKSKSALWKYMGIGLDRKHSGQGRAQVKVTTGGSRQLKGIIMGAAITAITMGNNPFYQQYYRWTTEGGLSHQNARRNVARSEAATMWGMWKNQTAYDPTQVGRTS